MGGSWRAPSVASTRAHQRAPTKTAAAGSPVAAVHPKALLLVLTGVLSGQCGDEGLLRDLDPAHGLHPLLAFLLLLQQLALPRDVTAVALGQDVLADRANRFAGDDPRTHRRLDRDLELLPRDQLAQPRRHPVAVAVGRVLVHDRRKRVH